MTAAPYPEMGCTTPASKPFSLRLSADLRRQIEDRATSLDLSVGEYLRRLIEADLSSKPIRRGRGPSHAIRRELARIHGAIIECGNSIEGAHRRCASELSGRTDVACGVDDDRIVATLRDIVSAVLVMGATKSRRK
jgi:hypothetical protein